MSNRAVSTTYRTIIDDVISNVRQEFEDMGIEKEVLEELQRSWEAKIVATGVADFEGAEPVAPRSRKESKGQPNGANGGHGEASSSSTVIKTEEGVDPASLSGGSSNSSNKIARTNGANDVRGGVASQTNGGSGHPSTSSSQASGGGGAMPIEGLLSSGGGDTSSANKRKRPTSDENEIGSDLDDSDEEELDGMIDTDGNEDLILCLYDKVQRVRNKWKCVLKDGVASIDGKDYVFSKLASELEW
ncbi:hypothetical protein CBS101457_003250 [Exobasidium rhododendri]|nr:hypothetical protein CBS101457_003250 [Exobasidium rhododendri]